MILDIRERIPLMFVLLLFVMTLPELKAIAEKESPFTAKRNGENQRPLCHPYQISVQMQPKSDMGKKRKLVVRTVLFGFIKVFS